MFFLKRQMALNAAEFIKLLPRAIAPFGYRVNEGSITVILGQGSVEIALQQLPPRNIASISLPVLQIEMSALDTDEAELAAFVSRFDRSFQRGGG